MVRLKLSPVMKISIRQFAACCLAMAAAACSQEAPLQTLPQTVESKSIPQTVITVSRDVIDGPAESKSVLENNRVLWETGDQIRLMSKNSPYNTYLFTLNSNTAGQAIGQFESESVILDSDYPLVAVFPASLIADNTVLNVGDVPCFKVSLPNVQSYRAGSPASNVMASCAYIENPAGLDNVNMKNLGGLLNITLKGSGVSVTRIALSVADEESFLAGTGLAVPFSNSNAPTLIDAGEVSTLSHRIELDCSNGGNGVALDNNGVPFHFFAPANTLGNGFGIEVETSDGYIMEKTAKPSSNSSIERSKRTLMPALTYKPTRPTMLGVYSLAENNIVRLASTTGEGMSQYGVDFIAANAKSHRIINWSDGYEIDLQTSDELDNTTNIEVSVQGSCSGVTADSYSVTKSHADAKGCWFVDNEKKMGFLLKDIE